MANNDVAAAEMRPKTSTASLFRGRLFSSYNHSPTAVSEGVIGLIILNVSTFFLFVG